MVVAFLVVATAIPDFDAAGLLISTVVVGEAVLVWEVIVRASDVVAGDVVEFVVFAPVVVDVVAGDVAGDVVGDVEFVVSAPVVVMA